MSILELSDGNYTGFIEETKSVVFIDFYSPTCGLCQTLLSFLPKLQEHYQNEEVVIAKADVTKNPKLANKFMVQSVPLTIVIGKDKMLKRVEVGLLGIDAYIKMIDKALGKGRILSRLFGGVLT